MARDIFSMISRDEAIKMVHRHIRTENLRKHLYAVAAIMRALAEKMDGDPDEWELTGLLHDIDYEETKDAPEYHGGRSAEMLQGLLPEHALRAIRAHNWRYTTIEPAAPLDHALIASDALSGLIVATALVMPHQRLAEVQPESVLKKFDDSSFARNIDRQRILRCRALGLDREDFVALALKALRDIHQQLGL